MEQHVFPQGVVDVDGKTEIRREGGLTFRQLAALMIWPSLAEAALTAAMLPSTQPDEIRHILNQSDVMAWKFADSFLAAEKD